MERGGAGFGNISDDNIRLSAALTRSAVKNYMLRENCGNILAVLADTRSATPIVSANNNQVLFNITRRRELCHGSQCSACQQSNGS